MASITAPWARKTKGLVQRLTAIGLALSGEAGMKLAQHLGLIVSRNTLLQLVRNLPLPDVGTPLLGSATVAFCLA